MADDFARNYHFVPVGDMFARPVRCRVQATFSASGATVTVSTDGRKSQVGAAITGSAGDYDVTGLPRGSAYHVVGVHMVGVADAGTVFQADVTAFDASAGTLSFLTREIGYSGAEAGAAVATGDAAAPPDTAQIHLTLDIETGVYS
jgi:hypothetical protein